MDVPRVHHQPATGPCRFEQSPGSFQCLEGTWIVEGPLGVVERLDHVDQDQCRPAHTGDSLTGRAARRRRRTATTVSATTTERYGSIWTTWEGTTSPGSRTCNASTTPNRKAAAAVGHGLAAPK